MVCRLLIAVTSLVAGQGLYGSWASEHRLNSLGAQLQGTRDLPGGGDGTPVSCVGRRILYH